jgi:hypothetical protein
VTSINLQSVAPDLVRSGVFVSYRRADTGWAAIVVAGVLQRRLGQSSEVFLDNRSIGLGQAFARALEDGVRRSAVFVVLIGPLWDEPPLVDRLTDPEDWVRKEILLAEDCRAAIIPVLVDREDVPAANSLPEELRFLPGLQVGRIRQYNDRDPDVFAERVANLMPTPAASVAASAPESVERTRSALEDLLRRILPPAQQWIGNRDRLVDLALAVLGPDDRLIFLAPGRINDGPRGSSTVLLTGSDVTVVEVDESFLVSGEIRFPRGRVRRVQVVPTLPLFADALIQTTAGDTVRLQGLFRDQAQQLADHLRR